MRLLKLFVRIVKLRFFALIEYPGAFATGIVAQWISYGIEIGMLFLMVDRFGALGGWSPDEVLLLYAVWLMSYALGASFTFNVARNFRHFAVDGALDEALTRPVPSLFYLIAANYNLGYISHVTLSLGVLVFSVRRLQLAWTPAQWLWLALLIASASVIQGCLMLLFDLPSLKLKGESPIGVFFWEGRLFGRYPLSIYPRPLQWLFSSALPFAFVGYQPLTALLGKTDALFGRALTYLSPPAAALLILITIGCWNRTVRRYESAGT